MEEGERAKRAKIGGDEDAKEVSQLLFCFWKFMSNSPSIANLIFISSPNFRFNLMNYW
ncbi:hypothetical protein V2J09_014286 [Rumex salicifolius]